MADYEGTGAQIRRRFRDLEPFLTDADPNGAFAEYVSLGPATPLGHTRQTFTSSPSSILYPQGAKRVQIRNLSTDTTLYFTDIAGQDPSVSLGFPIMPQEWLNYDTEPTSDLKFFAAGSVEVAFAFYA